MKFRDRQVDGFFVITTDACGALLSHLIEARLNELNADMEDVQYSTHTMNGQLYNDVLVMYRTRKEAENDSKN